MSDIDISAAIVKLEETVKALLQRITELEESMPGTYATREYVATYVEHLLGDIMPIHDPLTESSFIVGYIPLDIEKVLKHFRNIGGSYTLYDYRRIVTYYDFVARQVDINPYIAVAQMVKETDWCRSWWSQRPRRNPAGIGVTGEESTKTQNKDSWALDNKGVWRKGYSFASWEIATKAHIGHLLAYIYKDKELTHDQGFVIANDPRARFIPENNRGSVKALKDLDGKWASPGLNYGRSIATIANALNT